MSARQLERSLVPAHVVVLRVCLDGLLWGPVGGMFFALLLVVGDAAREGVDGHVVLKAATRLLGAVVLGALAGGFVGVSVAPVAALVLLGSRRVTSAAASIATLVTLVYLGGSLSLQVGVVAPETTGIVLGVCVVAAWPMHRSLRRAQRPVREPS